MVCAYARFGPLHNVALYTLKPKSLLRVVYTRVNQIYRKIATPHVRRNFNEVGGTYICAGLRHAATRQPARAASAQARRRGEARAGSLGASRFSLPLASSRFSHLAACLSRTHRRRLSTSRGALLGLWHFASKLAKPASSQLRKKEKGRRPLLLLKPKINPVHNKITPCPVACPCQSSSKS